ncbi:hypothetical protein Gpo141_00002966 [Globisporangium polare]
MAGTSAAQASASAAARDGLSAISAPSSSSATSSSTIQSNLSVKYEFNAGALSVDAAGSFGVLAGRKGLHLVDLEAPYMPAATLHHQTKWEVTVVKCNPHVQFRGHVASTSNHNTLIWNIANAHGGMIAQNSRPPSNSSQPLIATLRAHTRPVSDISWSPTEPWILATCSADTKTHLWDIRTPQKPVQTLYAFTSSAIQVEWNRVDQTSIATAHDGEVRIWDTRASDRTPAVMITAHMQKIYGIDWHPTRMYELVTCSEDKTVKFWNVTQPRMCQGMLTTGAPVWRARYTPFGDGLVTISHRLDNNLRLWALSHSEPSGIVVDPVHTYSGHSDLVRGFEWRARPHSGVYQLVSWAKNQELRMWRVDSQHLEACGYDTTSYTEVSQSEPIEMLRTDVSRLQYSSKYDISALRTDFVPLVVPPNAVPLGASEYSLAGHADSMNALLVFDEDLAKIGETASSDDEAGPTSSGGAANGGTAAVTAGGDAGEAKEKSVSATGSRASALPCPRFSGACFSGPNMLIVFDSRVAIGQTRTSAVPAAAVAAGKQPVKTPAPVNKMPRTYEELLDLRDSRFATKKNKKPPVKLLSASNVIGSMDMTGEWGQHELMDNGMFNDETESSMHGFRTNSSSMFFTSSTMESGPQMMMMDHGEKSVHGGSEYLKTYFTSSEYHLPINHPEHRISVPVSAGNSSPRGSGLRAGVAGVAGERAKRLEQTPGASLNLDLSLSVTALDLSKLCGVSSILTYKTEIVPQKIQVKPVVDDQVDESGDSQQIARPPPPPVLESGSRSLLSWMLQAAERTPAKGSLGRVHPVVKANGNSDGGFGQTGKNHLSHVLQSLLQTQNAPSSAQPAKETEPAFDEEVTTHSVSNTCAHNSRVASLAGRSDLQKVWSLLEISTAPSVDLPIYKQNSSSLNIASGHPWSAHPFGKRLVDKILTVYEHTGDLPAVASIVCALKPSEANSKSETESVASRGVKHTQSVGGADMGSVTVASSDDDFYFVNTHVSQEGMRSRRSSNALSQLTDNYPDAGDIPPAMRSTRRAISHSEVGRSSFGDRSLSADRGDFLAAASGLRVSKDWAAPSTANRLLSPVRTPPAPSSRTTPKGTSIAAGWRMDFESPFKTWSSGGSSTKEASPRRNLTHETFLSPMASMPAHPEHGPLPEDHVVMSNHSQDNNCEDEVCAADRITLQLSYPSPEDNCLLSTNPADEERYDVYKTSYADLLYRYGAIDLRTDVLKTVSTEEPEHEGIEFGLLCHSCQTPTSDPVCGSCRDFAVKCSVCQLVVRGQSMFCMTCGHGGHAEHLRDWFEVESSCPTGCGCWCKAATASLSAFPMAEAPEERVPSRSFSF